VTLNRLATAFLVLAMPAFLDIGSVDGRREALCGKAFFWAEPRCLEPRQAVALKNGSWKNSDIKKIKVVLII
jgi:hypothetical protein